MPMGDLPGLSLLKLASMGDTQYKGFFSPEAGAVAVSEASQ